MPRGEAAVTKVFYKGNTEDFIIYAESPNAVKEWKEDRSIPLAQVVSGFKIMITHKQGAQGKMDTASKSTLENEFGTPNEDECIIKSLEKGHVQISENSARMGDRNDMMSSRQAHNPGPGH